MTLPEACKHGVLIYERCKDCESPGDGPPTGENKSVITGHKSPHDEIPGDPGEDAVSAARDGDADPVVTSSGSLPRFVDDVERVDGRGLPGAVADGPKPDSSVTARGSQRGEPTIGNAPSVDTHPHDDRDVLIGALNRIAISGASYRHAVGEYDTAFDEDLQHARDVLHAASRGSAPHDGEDA